MKKTIFLLALLSFMIHCNGQNIVLGRKDKTGNLWFTVYGKGVYRYDGKAFFNFTKAYHRSRINITAFMYDDQNGNLWFNTAEGLCIYDGEKFTPFEMPMVPVGMIGTDKYRILSQTPIKVLEMLQDKTGNFWFLTADHGVYRYQKKLSDSSADSSSFFNFLLDEVPNCILESKKGDIYIGSWRGGGVYRYERQASIKSEGKSLSTVTEKFTSVNGFSDGMIACMFEDKTGKIWVGTRNAAADLYDPDQKSVANFSKKNGLTDNTVCCLLEDSKGNMWFGGDAKEKTARGDAFCYNGKYFTNITAEANLTLVAGYVYSVKSMVEDKLGNIWIGSGDGMLLCYDGKKFIDFTKSVSD